MNAPLPEHIRKALETVTLDDKPHGGLQHKYSSGGAAGRAGFVGEQVRQGSCS